MFQRENMPQINYDKQIIEEQRRSSTGSNSVSIIAKTAMTVLAFLLQIELLLEPKKKKVINRKHNLKDKLLSMKIISSNSLHNGLK